MEKGKPVIAITMGDPSGIGPEIILKALEDPRVYEKCIPFVIGHAFTLKKTARGLGSPRKIARIQSPADLHPTPRLLFLMDPAGISFEPAYGVPTVSGGLASGRYIEKAAELALRGNVDAVTTAPINKESLNRAGYLYPGHTEFLAALSHTDRFGMLMSGGPLRIVFVTIHEPISRVPSLIQRERVLKTLRLANDGMKSLFGIPSPVIGVASLNPHGGEKGLFGEEEQKEILPAIQIALSEGIRATGPISPDALFFKAYRKEFDAVVVMYHDQGLIPLKMIAFKQSVNLTLGLPFIRTSVDHGTAYDIAGKGMADPSSLKEALFLATELFNRRK